QGLEPVPQAHRRSRNPQVSSSPAAGGADRTLIGAAERGVRCCDVDPTPLPVAKGRWTKMDAITVSAQVGNQQISIETGKLAKQADGSVVLRAGDSMVLVTAVSQKEPKPGFDFFPLTVDYQERLSAAGRIPGSFFRREGRLTERETLTSRLIDRSLRPLFP